MAYEFNHYYELQNVATGKYVNVLGNHEDGTVKNGETVNLFSRTNNPDQRWALENFGGNGNVRIVLQRGEGWYALNYNTRNTNCIVWHLNTADDTDTVITTVEVENRPNTYYLMLRDRSIYLTAVGTALKWSAYTGEEEQMFTILEPGTGSDGSDSGEVSNVPDSKLVLLMPKSRQIRPAARVSESLKHDTAIRSQNIPKIKYFSRKRKFVVVEEIWSIVNFSVLAPRGISPKIVFGVLN